MCDGGVFSLPIASLLIGTASAVANGQAQAQQAQAQAAYQEAQAAEYARTAELNNQAAIREYTEQSAAERISQMQEQQAASQQAQDAQKEMLQKQGTMLASTNAAGMALNYLMADYEREQANQKDRIRQQYEMNAVGHELNLASFKDKAQNRINTQQSYITQGTSFNSGMNTLGTILGIGGSLVNAYDKYDKYNNGRTNITSTASKKRG